MTLREQCEAFLVKLMRQVEWAGLHQPMTKQIALEIVESFAKSQQAVGLREAGKRLDEFNDDMGRFDLHLQKIVEWLEQQAREREGMR